VVQKSVLLLNTPFAVYMMYMYTNTFYY